ncbi:glycerophosphoryl diester phosphodiesterase [Vibrio methylphosphonaticus]|uniref:glycerophosphoryl diester phosphodiesterase n=1 Tax=Vibrio methylphosphonaticus TaxID=2946866 RepID=UPI00202A5514|nr:glycerophosphoryl diester phosphodiesterase [Vibrio methylphosphonaticus]MCL9774253.1 glycerophosphoryl diester phosphodiesterase [Vibrio methylphosphonaticus]
MKLTAHRGVSSMAPENTLAAFNLAKQYNCDWVELDVQLSADNIPMVIHDKTVDRCSDGSGLVSQMTRQELQQLDVGSWFDSQYNNEKIPTLSEVLTLAKENGTKVNIEIKRYPGDEVFELCDQIKNVIDSHEIALSDLLFSSFDNSILKYLGVILPDIKRGQLWQSIPDNAVDQLLEIEAYSVHCDYRYLSKEQAVDIKRLGYELYCYTPNIPSEVAEYWGWGVDMMITDKPQTYCSSIINTPNTAECEIL